MLRKINIDKSGAYLSVIRAYNAEFQTDIEIRQVKYLNNIVEQDHGAIKRIIKGMLGFQSIDLVSITLNDFEMVRMIRKGQIENENDFVQSTAGIFYDLAA